jgi:ADYC domain
MRRAFGSGSLAVAGFAALLAACGGSAGAPGFPAAGARQAELDTPNGKSINGTMLNGKSVNGTSLAGLYIASVSWPAALYDGNPLAVVSLSGTVFSGTAGSKNLLPQDFVGVVFKARLSDGSDLGVRFDSWATLPAQNSDLNAYAVSYETSLGWQPLCGTEADGSRVLAIPVNGKFDYTQGTSTGGSYDPRGPIFTMACRHYAIAKCAEMGYRPWQSASGTSLRDYFRACTRMLRADYCGDGNSYTINGTLIDVYDRLGVQQDTENWRPEAEWGPNGATCMAPAENDRWYRNPTRVPSCYSALVNPACGTFNSPSTLIIDEFVEN